MEIEVLQERFRLIVVEIHMPEFNVTNQRLPVFFPRVHRRSVFFHDFFCVRYIGLCIQQSDNALSACLCALKLCKDTRQVLNRIKQAGSVADEGDQHTGCDHTDKGLGSAECRADSRASEYEGERCRDRGEGDDQREKDSRKDLGLDGRLLEFGRDLLELFAVRFFTDQGLGGHGAHDPFVERAGDPAVLLPRRALILQNCFLQNETDHGKRGDNDQHDQGESPVEDKHRDHGEDDIEGRP